MGEEGFLLSGFLDTREQRTSWVCYQRDSWLNSLNQDQPPLSRLKRWLDACGLPQPLRQVRPHRGPFQDQKGENLWWLHACALDEPGERRLPFWCLSLCLLSGPKKTFPAYQLCEICLPPCSQRPQLRGWCPWTPLGTHEQREWGQLPDRWAGIIWTVQDTPGFWG